MSLSMLSKPELADTIASSPLIVTPNTPLVEVLSLMNQYRQTCPLPSVNPSLEDGLPSGAALSEIDLWEYERKEDRSSCILVTDREQLVGIFTARDLLRHATAQLELETVTVAEVMSIDPVTLERSQFRDIFIVLNLFRQHRIHHLPIVDKCHRVVGLVTPTTVRQVLKPTDMLRMRSVVEAMNPQVVQTSSTASVLEVARLMAEHQVSCVAILEPQPGAIAPVTPSTETGDRAMPIGVVTEGDIVQFLALELDLEKIQAREVMSTPVFSVSQQTSLWEADRQMQQSLVRHLFVKNTQEELLGIVTQMSILQSLDPIELYQFIDVLQHKVTRLETENEKLLNFNYPQKLFDENPHVIEVLLVEDTRLQAILIKKGLKCKNQFNFRVEVAVAQTVAETKQKLNDAQFDVILLDLNLPDSSGIDTLLRVKKQAPNVPIVVLTYMGRSETELAVACLKQGAQDYLLKEDYVTNMAGNQDMLLRSIRYAIERHQVEAHLKLHNAQLESIEQQLQQEVTELQLAEKALEEARDNLEQRVAERTSELQATNDRLWQEIRDRERMEKVLRNIALGVGAETGEAFFQSLVQYLALALEVEYVVVSKFIDSAFGRVKTVAVSVKGKIIRNFEYDLANTPCHNMVKNRFLFSDTKVPKNDLAQKITVYPAQVWEQFPQDYLLQELKIEGYFGIPLVNSEGALLGAIEVLSSQPFTDVKFKQETIQIFAVRAASELERQQAEEFLRTSEEKYRQLNQQLEERVNQRTAELEQTNQQLQQEIIERQQAEIALRESQAELQELFENANDLIQSVSLADGRFLYVNRAWRETLGYTEEEISRLSIFEAIHPDYQEHYREILSQLQAGAVESLEAVEVVFLTKDKQQIILEGNVNCRLENGTLTATRWIIRDITGRRLVETHLQNVLEELKYQKLALDRMALVSIADANGIITYANDKFCEISQYSRKELIGKTHRIVNSGYHPCSFFEQMWSTVTKGKVWRNVIKNRAKDGSYYWVDSTIVPFLDEDGQPFQFLALRIDITERKEAEQKLRESQERLNTVINHTAEGIIVVSQQGIIRFVNPTASRILGYSQESLLNTHWGIPLPGEDCQEVQLFCRDRTLITVDLGVININWEGESAYLASLRDITERKEIEEQIRRNEAEFRGIFEQAAVGITQTDLDERFVKVNQGLCHFLGYDLDEILTKTLSEITHPDEREIDREYLDRLVMGKIDTFSREKRFLHKNGVTVWGHITMSLVRSQLGEPDYSIAVVEDISDRKQAEAELRQAKEQLQAVLDAVPGLISWVSYEPENPEPVKYQGVNQHLADTFQVSTESFVDKPVGFIQDNSDFGKLIPGFFAMEEQQISREISINLFGNPRDYLLVAQKYNRGKAAVSVGIDISDRKQAEETLRIALAKEKELSDLKTRFISMTSHEFRTPLAVIASSAGIIKSFAHKLSDEKKREHLQTIETYVKHATALLEDILLINRAESGKIDFNPQLTEIISFCKTIADEMQLSTSYHTIAFLAHCGDKQCVGEAANVYVDQKLLRQILINLLSNAIKYSPEGGEVNFDLSVTDESLIFQVKDRGIGIPSADRKHLFQSFNRANNVGTIQGTGLGLSIVKKCVDLHGGKISLESEIDQGTTFAIAIPSRC